MTDREPEQVFDEPASVDGRDRERLTTADMAAAAPARAPITAEAEEHDTGKPRQTLSTQAGSPEEAFEPLFDEGESENFRSRWYEIQAGFVDQPRKSVESADELVATVMKRLAEVFAAERENLEHEWGTGDDISTEDLRLALRRYRSFFDRLLAV